MWDGEISSSLFSMLNVETVRFGDYVTPKAQETRLSGVAGDNHLDAISSRPSDHAYRLPRLRGGGGGGLGSN